MATARSSYTATDLHERTRSLHRPKILLRNPGWICVGSALALSLLGVVAIAGSTEPELAMRHLRFLAVGIVAATVVALPHYRWARDLSYVLMIGVLGLLVFVLIPTVPDAIVHPIKGARRWINLGVTNFQPSELAKIVYVLVLANYLRYRSSYRKLTGLLVPFLLSFVPMALILKEPDLGTALLFLPTLFAMLVAAGAKLRHLVLIIALGLASAPVMYPVLKPHQKARIKAMIAQVTGDDTFDNDIGFQGKQATMLVGAGGIVGVGRERAHDLIRFNSLPEDHNDMIFAVICCRWGVAGALLTFALFGALAVGGLLVAACCKDPFGRLAAVGLVSMLLAQMTINAGMTIGLLPITGLTLPFISYGGSSLVCTWLVVGLLLNIAMRRPLYMTRESFDYDALPDDS
ncbi:MAG: FtsW/RodA/SpoVE family cell cycle protein [Planctomycetota bacterium]|jgi:cell division protein FtsW (lipid II flippase)